MANNVEFKIHLKVDGKEHVVQLGGDIQALTSKVKDASAGTLGLDEAMRKMGDAMGVARKDADNLNTSLVNLNQVAEAFSTLTSTVRDIQGAMQTLTAAYAVQERAEVQLQTVMKQRMGATEAEVESIKALASAQQELGVIGNEVQLMGAQQMATFMNEKGSIETLLPAMNDLLAQRKGLNATEQDAVSIGNLLGKAMEGQTSALERVGISFTEAQEQVMKYGTESQRAAMLSQVITDNVGHMNAELAKTDIGRQKQLENTLGDIREQFGQLVQPAMRAITVVASTTQAVSGITKLYTSIKGLHAAMLTATASSTALKWSIRGLEIATGIGAILAALSIAVEVFGRKADKAAESAGELADETDGLAAALQREESQVNASRAALEINIERLRNFTGTKAEEKKIVEEMNGVYGETMGYFDSVAKWYDALTKNSEAYCRQLVVEAKMRALANQVASDEMEADQLRKQIAEGGLSDKRETRTEWKSANGAGSYKVEVEIVGSSELDKAKTRLADLTKEGESLTAQMKEAAAEASKIVMPVKGAGTRPTGGDGGGNGDKGKIAGGMSGLSAMAGTQNLTFEVQGLGFDSLTAQVVSLGDALERPMSAWDQFVNLLNKAVEAGGLTGETFTELQGVMDSLNMTSEQQTEVFTRLGDRINATAKDSKKYEKNTKAAAQVTGAFADALSSMGDDLGVPALNIAGTIAQAIANVAMGYASASASAGESGNPWVWMAFTLAGLAEMVSVIATIKNATAFAEGGIISGPTYALMGEYAGASNNPEVVAPLSKLREMIEPETGVSLPERIELEVDGRNLRAVLIKTEQGYRRG